MVQPNIQFTRVKNYTFFGQTSRKEADARTVSLIYPKTSIIPHQLRQHFNLLVPGLNTYLNIWRFYLETHINFLAKITGPASSLFRATAQEKESGKLVQYNTFPIDIFHTKTYYQGIL
jgi:hypothetical protein